MARVPKPSGRRQRRDRTGVITKDDVLPLILAACPSFIPPEADDEDGRLDYVDAGAFAHHLVELAEAGSTGQFQNVFEVIERLHVDGDGYVRELATIGYLEALQNVSEPSPKQASRPGQGYWEPYLLPVSRRRWDALNAFWAGDTSALTPDDDL